MFVPTPRTDATGMRIAVVTSRYHQSITSALAAGARQKFLDSGGSEDDLLEITAPGTFELPVICSALAQGDQVDAIVALGCVVTGETRHDEYISHAVVRGLIQISIETGVPVALGVLTVANLDQARARSGGGGGTSSGDRVDKGNKGEEAMAAAIDAVLATSAAMHGFEAPDEDER